MQLQKQVQEVASSDEHANQLKAELAVFQKANDSMEAEVQKEKRRNTLLMAELDSVRERYRNLSPLLRLRRVSSLSLSLFLSLSLSRSLLLFSLSLSHYHYLSPSVSFRSALRTLDRSHSIGAASRMELLMRQLLMRHVLPARGELAHGEAGKRVIPRLWDGDEADIDPMLGLGRVPKTPTTDRSVPRQLASAHRSFGVSPRVLGGSDHASSGSTVQLQVHAAFHAK